MNMHSRYDLIPLLRRHSNHPARLPLDELLRRSLYYPACGLDGDPVRFLAGRVQSFVYADCWRAPGDVRKSLYSPDHAFKGYECLFDHDVSPRELGLCSWAAMYRPRHPDWKDRHTSFHRLEAHAGRDGFGIWSIFRRLPAFPVSHGPEYFSLLYLGTEGVTTYLHLYGVRRTAPRILVLMKSGFGFGGNWIRFDDPGGPLAGSVNLCSPLRPELLLTGNTGRYSSEPVWPKYSDLVQRWRIPEGWLSLWRRGAAAKSGSGMFLRAVKLPVDVPGRLFASAMPGRYSPLNDHLREITAACVDRIVCLAPLEEIATKSPYYAERIRTNTLPCKLTSVPVPDGVPPERNANHCYPAACEHAAKDLMYGHYILIHCAAGIERTGKMLDDILHELRAMIARLGRAD